ncbi:hypothetical protein GGX14DRAFT_557087 [Mycena pura]|uniref:Uncharacterized protein n=1 Tax=Mycena pura TaxID=153505 RepID=A0AAD7E1T0_9AGAR|nr:hypothetical protein GGX14DRAFT_557087 [Mycena pura]
MSAREVTARSHRLRATAPCARHPATCTPPAPSARRLRHTRDHPRRLHARLSPCRLYATRHLHPSSTHPPHIPAPALLTSPPPTARRPRCPHLHVTPHADCAVRTPALFAHPRRLHACSSPRRLHVNARHLHTACAVPTPRPMRMHAARTFCTPAPRSLHPPRALCTPTARRSHVATRALGTTPPPALHAPHASFCTLRRSHDKQQGTEDDRRIRLPSG